jgi:predicted transposase YbfD/YdcC
LRRSYQKKEAKAPIHMVSAFAARQRLVLGQVKVNEKSNEIVAIPALLDMMAIEGAVVTIDAMGCQRNIAKKITDKKSRLHPRAQGQSGNAARGWRGFRHRAENKGLQGNDNQSARDDRWRSRAHRNQNLRSLCCQKLFAWDINNKIQTTLRIHQPTDRT